MIDSTTNEVALRPRTRGLFCAAVIAAALQATATGDVLFSDDFTDGASVLWGNEIGDWSADGGVYTATHPSNSPPTVTSLPFMARDFTVEVDVNDIQDGGIWLRCAFDPTTGVARDGVLLVTGGNLGTYSGFYWHIVQNGAYSPLLEPSGPGLFEIGVSDVTIRAEVTGNTYRLFLGDDSQPATTLTTDLFCDGRVGLYDFSNQTYDNFVLTEITPACLEDVDCDGQVNVNDLLLFLGAWGDTSGRADIDRDGVVDVTDLLAILGAWGPCP